MSAKLMKAMNIRSSFSNREKIRRKPLRPRKQPFDLIASLVHGAVVFPRRDAILLGWNDGDEPKIERELPGLVPFVCAVHQEMERPWGFAEMA